MKLISNRMLREFAERHAAADTPLRAFRMLVEKGCFQNFAELRASFRGVDKVGDLYVFNVGGNKFRVVAGIAFAVQTVWINRVLKNVARMAGCKAHGAQRPRHINGIGEEASTAQRRRRPSAVVFNALSRQC